MAFRIGAAVLAVTAEALIAWWFGGRPQVQHDEDREGEPRSDLEQTRRASKAD